MTDTRLNPVAAVTAPTISGGYSEAFFNGDQLPGHVNPYGDSFIQDTRPLAQFVKHVLDGKAVIPHAFKGNTRRNETFHSTIVYGLDLESDDRDVSIADARAISFHQEHAFLTHSTRSSGKIVPNHNDHGYKRSRTYGLFSESIEGVERARVLFKAVAIAHGLPLDNASFKPAQPWFGSTNRIEQPYINLNAQPVDVWWVAGYLVDIARAEMEHDLADRNRPAHVPVTGTRAENYAQTTLENELHRAASAPNGERNSTLYGVARKLYSYMLGGWPGFDETTITRELESIARDWPNFDKSRNTIKNGLKGAVPKPLELAADPPPAKPLELPKLDAGVTLNQRYISTADLPQTDVIALKSDTGTGKTKTAIQLFASASGAIYLTHRERLAENFSRDAQRQGVAVEHYKNLWKSDWRKPPRLTICINSYSMLADEKPGLPVPDLLIGDEIEQLLDHVYGQAKTFKKHEAINAAEALKFALRHAKRVIVSDAHLSDLAVDFLKACGREIVTVVNEYTPDRGSLTIHKKRDGAISKGIDLVLADQGVVAFAFGSQQRAQTIAADLAELLGSGEAVLCVTAENSGGERQSAFLADPNGQIGQYRAVVFSPVIGTGFDITAPVRAVVGVMGAHLTAYDARQMIGRCRNTQETHVFIPQTAGDLEENPAQIEVDELQKANRTKYILTDDGVRTAEIDPQQRDYLHWHARVMARRNWSINHLRDHFVSLCAGYTISYSETSDPALSARQKEIKKARENELKELALTAEPVNPEDFEFWRNAGKIDTETIAGHRRWQIENVIGVTISPAVRDSLWTPDQRRVLRNFTDLYDQIGELKAADAQETIDGIPLHKRKHRAMRRIIGDAVLHLLIPDGELLTLTDAELESAAKPFVEHYAGDLRRLFGWRPGRCTRAAAIIKRVLKTVGLVLDSEQQRINGVKTRVYRLNRETWEQIYALAKQRLAMLERKRREAEGGSVPVLKVPYMPSTRGNGSFETPTFASPHPLSAVGAPGGWREAVQS